MTPAEIAQKRDELIADVITFLFSDDGDDITRRDDAPPDRAQPAATQAAQAAQA